MSAGADGGTPSGQTGAPQGFRLCKSLRSMSLDYAADQLLAAVRSMAESEGPLQTRLQRVWDESVQHVWEKPCLTTELLARFKALWDRVTDPTAGPRSTRLRELTCSEAVEVVDELMALAVQAAVLASQAMPDARLATLADLA